MHNIYLHFKRIQVQIPSKSFKFVFANYENLQKTTSNFFDNLLSFNNIFSSDLELKKKTQENIQINNKFGNKPTCKDIFYKDSKHQFASKV